MPEPESCSTISSPIGELLIVSRGDALTGLHMTPHPSGPWERRPPRQDDALLRRAREQLWAYFAGELLDFDLPLDAAGTPFQQRVWSALRSIPYGQTVSYAEIARRIDLPTASRAVGAANGRNPIALIVPCHRVIGANGTLVGYGGGLDRKQWLLRHEAEILARLGRPTISEERRRGRRADAAVRTR
jgi:methylated-DNA-[protein]-cysteine S-methyltransferase